MRTILCALVPLLAVLIFETGQPSGNTSLFSPAYAANGKPPPPPKIKPRVKPKPKSNVKARHSYKQKPGVRPNTRKRLDPRLRADRRILKAADRQRRHITKKILPGAGKLIKTVSYKLPNARTWSGSRNQKNWKKNAIHHWKKHKSDFPSLKNATQYAKAAKSFLHNPPNKNSTLTRVRQDGVIVRYDLKTKTLASMNKNGTPITMHKVNPNSSSFPKKYKSGLDYFLNFPMR